MKKERIKNIPNTITLLRVIITLYIVYGAFNNFSLFHIAVAFCIGAITDFFDGVWARRFDCVTEFGRKFDMIADRFLMIITVLVVTFLLFSHDNFSNNHFYQILMIMSREIITAPFALIALIRQKKIPHAKLIGKTMTTLQGIAFPLVVVSVYFYLPFVIYFSVLTGLVGIFSAAQYIKDWWIIEKGRDA